MLPSPSEASVGRSQSADGLRKVHQRVGARVAVGVGVGERADAEGVDHQYEGTSRTRGHPPI